MLPYGLFSWVDLSAPDPKGAKAFYSQLFGWQTADQLDTEGNYIYTLFRIDGRAVAGLGGQSEELRKRGLPACWTSYINVESVDDSLALIKTFGGTVLMPGMEIMTAGRMGLASDPTGATFALWQAGTHQGAGLFNAPGALTWNELATRDLPAARRFYEQALGWTFERAEGMTSEYYLIKLGTKVDGDLDADDDFNGGLLAMDASWGELPSHWLVYFAVNDTDEVASRAKGLGGTITVAPFDETAGRIAILADPQGGAFCVITPS